jgi:lipopolysaccharide export system protein LptA
LPAKRTARAALATALLLGMLRPDRAGAQATPSIGTVGEFAAAGENYDPPHEQQPRWRLSGREAELREGGRYLLRQVRLEFFRPTGEREVWVAAPECIHDAAQSRAHSSGPIRIESGDARAAIEGEGFLWEQAAATLIISNHVRATLQRALTNPPPAPLLITSRWFLLEITNRRAVFHEQVRGEDAESEFTCGRLAVHAAGTNAMFDQVQAEEGVAILEKATARRLTARQALYTRADERAELLGDVAWTQPGQSGRAERLVLNRRDGSARAEGRVTLLLPPETLGFGVVLGNASNAAPVELRADAVFSQTNFVSAEGQVRLRSGTNELVCERLVARLDAARQSVESALAQGKVQVQRSGGTLRAERAEYTRASGQVVFSGQPEWRDARGEGRAARLILQTDTGQLLAEGDVNVTLPLSGQTGSALALFPEATPTNAAPPVIGVSAESLATEPRRAVFRGSVRAHQLPVNGSEPRLQCDVLELEFAGGDASASAVSGSRLEVIRARGHVVCERGDAGATNGPMLLRRLSARSLTARADAATGALTRLEAEGDVVLEQPGSRARSGRAVYEAETGVLELSEAPELETRGVLVRGAHALLWDRTRDRYAMSGPFKARIRAEAARELADTIQKP